jgi:hypothetical protein
MITRSGELLSRSLICAAGGKQIVGCTGETFDITSSELTVSIRPFERDPPSIVAS